jgi:hypothetical protein
VPEVAAWAKKAGQLVQKWHPIIARMLPSEGFTPPKEVKIVFKNMRTIAYASGNTITISAGWIKKNPGDYGMVVHELTHVIQRYRGRGNPGWLVEGIADYVRFFHYEPGTKLRIRNPRRASYRDGYRTSAQFLAWIARTHDKKIVVKLNAAMRGGHYGNALFKKYTGQTLDELWKGFIKAVDS